MKKCIYIVQILLAMVAMTVNAEDSFKEMSKKTISIDPDFLYKPLKIETTNVLFWGCLHLNHLCEHWETPLWKQRGYGSAQEHFDALIKNWNSKADNETVGFLLGDSVFGKGADKNLETFFNAIKFKRIYLMMGNHYAGISQILDRLDTNIWQVSEGKEVIFIPNYFEIFVDGQPITMSHYPILSWNGAARGSWMLYAHVHGNLDKSEVGRMYQSRGKSAEISVDTNTYPARFTELRWRFAYIEAYAPDHHTKDTQNPF